jgi:hypothetical protein
MTVFSEMKHTVQYLTHLLFKAIKIWSLEELSKRRILRACSGYWDLTGQYLSEVTTEVASKKYWMVRALWPEQTPKTSFLRGHKKDS